MKKQTKTTHATIAGLAQAATVEAKPVKAKTVALRGGAAVAQIDTRGAKAYRTASKHNTDWFAQIQDACAKGPAGVAVLIEAGVPSHFVGYCLRKGYAVAV